MLVAMGEYLKRYGMTMEELGHLMTTAYERRMRKMPGLVRKLMGKMLTSPKLLNRLFPRKDARNAANAAKNPGSTARSCRKTFPRSAGTGPPGSNAPEWCRRTLQGTGHARPSSKGQQNAPTPARSARGQVLAPPDGGAAAEPLRER